MSEQEGEAPVEPGRRAGSTGAHLVCNDSSVADFLDPVLVKAVRLDEAYRPQRLHDGGFDRREDILTHASTRTIPAQFAAPVASEVVPSPCKAEAVLATPRGPIRESCFASTHHRHPGATLYLERDTARMVL